MTVRLYLRRSKNDEGKQQFSLDVQRAGCIEFVVGRGLATTETIIDYVDDGRAGDDFHTREGLRKLLAEARSGDVIVCRDQSRLGRDALEVTLVIRDLVRDHGCQLYYYTTGQVVAFGNAIDQATTFIQGTGHQMELEAIRSRTREALRSRVRAGRIAGGRCYGYALERSTDATGRPYTVAVVDPEQSAVVRRIYDEYLQGRGLKVIASRLNEEGVPSPTVGRRGRGSWAPSGIREMLRNPRYRGVYRHGKVEKVRRGGKLVRVEADPADIIAIDVPEWQIIDDATWFAVQELFEGRQPRIGNHGRPRARYPLTGIAQCGVCGGTIGSTRTRRSGGQHVSAYACLTHHTRGRSVCPVSIYQESEEIETGLLTYLQEHVLSPEMIDEVIVEIRAEIERELCVREADTTELEAELARVRGEQRKLARYVAMADDVPELLSELKRRQARVRYLETEIATASRTPEVAAELMARVEATARAKLLSVREALLGDRAGLRELFLSLFPDGLVFTPSESETRRVWTIEGMADLGGFNLRGDPTGT